MIPVEALTAHPANARRDLDLNPEFLASIEENGVLVPLRITTSDGETYRVIEGHRRLAAAVKLGLAEVPYDLATDRADDEAGQFLDMVTLNRHRNPLTPLEEADALFAAREAGAPKARIRKSTGFKAARVNAALAAATLSGDRRDTVEQAGYDLTLEDLALLAEFQDDPEALARLLDAASYSDNLEHHAERLRVERQERAEHERLRATLEAGGLTITDTRPPGATTLSALRHDGEDVTPESHATCPGHRAYFVSYDLANPVYYCADAAAHGHVSAWETTSTPGSPPSPEPAAPPEDAAGALSRRVVIEGNRAWKAAAQVRHRWLAEKLFARRTAPREAAPFVARQLLSMPGPLRSGLHLAHNSPVFARITGQDASKLVEACDSAPAGRLPLLMLAPVVATYEEGMTEGLGKDTWRPDRYSPCPHEDAGVYLTFLDSVGYQLSAIEQAVADARPYTGEASSGGDALPADGAEPAADPEQVAA
jgi:ParB family chromosome partitioning protein